MRRNAVLLSFLTALVGVSLLCWLVMFLAGHDVWSFVGKPDFWRSSGPPYSDVRAFAVAFYAQFFLLSGVLVALAVSLAWQVAVNRRQSRQAT